MLEDALPDETPSKKKKKKSKKKPLNWKSNNIDLFVLPCPFVPSRVSERSGRVDGVVPGRRGDGVWEHPCAVAATPCARLTGRRPCRYVNESMTAANEIKAVVEKMKDNLRKAEAVLDAWSAQPLLKRSGKAQPVDDFEQLQKVTLKERYDVIKKVRDSASVSEPHAIFMNRLHLLMTCGGSERNAVASMASYASAPRRAATRSIC